MHIEITVDIEADPATVWEELIDVERWPEWTASMREVKRLDTGPMALGSRARIRQPKMPVLVWEVTGFEEGREFTWSSHSAGVSTAGIHRVSANPDGTSTVFLAVDQTGVLAPLVGLFTGAQTRRYLGLEAHGLKHRSEGA
ncbi:SRPBCC family protein [Rugosimonospora africana]|uniref:Polyketide cyclase / dehydrase and lipid transport n=1 Tax=Rugosimonospora africana TaxID=556532 RepID=A0A8J3QUX0_9ACTN|nr:SRPBCC family protein [Rugosimonospora africana]GIH16936.1 hypothetical protein Raf01_51080 [Rugosimonospora africana]